MIKVMKTAKLTTMGNVGKWLYEFLPVSRSRGNGRACAHTLPEFLPNFRPEQSNIVVLEGPLAERNAVLWGLLGALRELFLTSKLASCPPELEFLEGCTGRVLPLKPVSLQAPGTATVLGMLGERLLDPVPEQVSQVFGWAIDEFRSCAAHWDSNLIERRGSLDPEAYAIELKEMTKGVLNVEEAWTKLADHVLRDVAARFGRPRQAYVTDPIIVLPVEDVDAYVSLTPHLLQLLPKLWHRRVVFLLSGSGPFEGFSNRFEVA
jgi:hypothetical protein